MSPIRSIYALQRGGLPFLNGRRRARRFLLAEQLARQALLADDGVRIRRLTAASADVGKPVFGPPQAKVRSLLTGLARPGLIDDLTGLLVRTLLLWPGRPRLRRAQLEIGR